MKTITISGVIFLLFISAGTLLAQANDPLANFDPGLRSDEIVAFTDWKKSQVFDYLNVPGKGDTLYPFPEKLNADSLGNTDPGYLFMDVITGNFIGDTQEEVVAAWEGPNRSVSLVISRIDPNNKEWSDLYVAQSDTGILMHNFLLDRWWIAVDIDPIKLVAGNFDEDTQEEFVLAYWLPDSTVKLTLYDADESGNFYSKTTIADQQIFYHFVTMEDKAYSWFDLAAEDFNNDGIDEVVLVGTEKRNGVSWDIFVKIYAIDLITSQFIPQVKEIAFSSTEIPPDIQVPILNRIIVTTGNFSNGTKNEGVIGFFCLDTTNIYAYQQKIEGYLTGFQVSQDLMDMTLSTKTPFVYKDGTTNSQLINYDSPFNLVSGDLNNDGLDEILVVQKDIATQANYCIKIFQADSLLKFTEVFEKNFTRRSALPPNKHIVKIANVDYDSTSENYSLNEIIFLEVYSVRIAEFRSEWRYEICVYGLEWDSTGVFQELKLKAKSQEYKAESDHYCVITGDFDGEDVYLGRPRRYSKTEVLQPLVVLNAPPVHYDIFDGVAYDVSKSYPPNEPMFYTAYNKDVTNVVGIETTVSQNWSRSMGVSASLSGWGIGLDMSMTNRYGENFSKVTGSSRSIKISFDKTAYIDDYIYATTVDYDFWEYPAYIGSELIGYILVTVPIRIEHTWFPSKLPSANDWVPNHEVGNILSYQEYPELNSNAEVAALIKGTYEMSWVLDGESEANWSLTFQDFSNSQTSTTQTIHMDYNVSIGFWGIGTSFSGSYDEEQTYTHQTTVTQDLSLKTHLHNLDMSIGQVYYKVTPYTYWSTYGALVLDYAVKPDLAQFDQLWWQQHYGQKPDPAFILPWRYDPEKGKTLDDPTWRQKTKEILFYPSEPVHGDTVTIMARIHNYSLLSTFDPITIRFYVGDPDSGGTLIMGTESETEISTNEQLLARDNAIVQMKWVIPADLEQFPRIYAVLDPDNVIDEIHENNNKGWSVLGKSRIAGIEEKPEPNLPLKYALNQNYPNPFNPSTKIRFALPRPEIVKIQVFDILGRHVKTLLDQSKQAGFHEVTFNADQMSSGVYIYRIEAGAFHEAKKMLILK
ncbi:T9SS type A sorting domain-containing protein [candidate division KSB1 bacterium]|nr:T9SS type A sorting domain-containing protein [candidate division KSB1 bacterium]